MTTQSKNFDRRTFIRAALAGAAAIPIGGALASCATSGSTGGTSSAGGASGSAGGATGSAATSADNPFGMAPKSNVDAVVFNGGYGIDYVTFAAKEVEKNHPGSTVKVSPTTQVAQELQPRFVGGNPPDLIDNSGANAIGFNQILDSLEDLSDVFAAKNLQGKTIEGTLYPGVKAPGTFGGKFAAMNYVLTLYGMWYSGSLYKQEGWTPPKTWDDAVKLGAAAKKKNKYLFVWGKEAATYYQTLAIGSAIKQGGDDVRLALENLEKGCWSKPEIQDVFKAMDEIVAKGYFKPGGAGTQFTQAQAQWTQAQDAILYPCGSWIENEMKNQTKSGFTMMGVPELVLDGSSKMPYTALHSAAGEPYIVPSKGKNPAGGKEVLRTMLSETAATHFAKTKLAPTIVKGTVPADAFGSTALASQIKMLDAAGKDVFTWQFVDLYGMNTDQLVVWNGFLSGKMSVSSLTKALQQITDKVAGDSSIKKIKVT